jgi:hypothetical protein
MLRQADGDLCGYDSGKWRKQRLIAHEQSRTLLEVPIPGFAVPENRERT